MKLSHSLMAVFVAAASTTSLSQATNYSSISNQDGTIAPEDGEIVVNNNNVIGRGVGWNSGSGTTILEGNISVDSASMAVMINTSSGNAHLLFKTAKESDQIRINSRSSTNNAVVYTGTNAVDSSIVFDTTASTDKTVYITNRDDPEPYGTVSAIRGESGLIEIRGNLNADVYGDGIETSSLNFDNSPAVVHVTGNAVINSSKGVGLEAWNYSTITIDSNVDITSKSMGIYSFVGSTVTIGGSLGVTADRGIEATNGKIILNGIHGMNLRYPSASAIDVGSNNEGHVGTVIGNAGVYKFTGLMTASKGGLIDMDMRQDSDYTGYTKLEAAAPGTINISLSDTSRWTLTQDSTMTNLKMFEHSTVVFTITGQNDFTDITTATAMLASGSIVTVNLDGYDPVLNDEFRLIIAEDYDIAHDVVYNLGALNEGLYWDTGDFAATGILRVVGSLPIPEPAAATLALAALATAAWRRRRPAATGTVPNNA